MIFKSSDESEKELFEDLSHSMSLKLGGEENPKKNLSIIRNIHNVWTLQFFVSYLIDVDFYSVISTKFMIVYDRKNRKEKK